MIRLKVDLEQGAMTVTLMEQTGSQRDFKFHGAVEVVEKLAADLADACARARTRLGMPAAGSQLILPPGKMN